MAESRSDERPRRTREHIIASQSHNYIERFFIDKGHVVDRPAQDYGVDLLVNTFDENGYAEPGDVKLQLKASYGFRLTKDGKHLCFKLGMQHCRMWRDEAFPFFLILFDAKRRRAYWLYLQEYLDQHLRPADARKSVTVHVPLKNRFTSKTVDHMRSVKAEVVRQWKGHIQYGK